MMTVQPTDIAIFLVSFAACIYCFVLSRRLKALQNTKDGLGATIMALTKSISAISATSQETHAQTSKLASRLAQLMEEAGQTCSRIEHMTETMDSKHVHAIRQVDTAKEELSISLHKTLEETKEHILEMTHLMQKMQAFSRPGPRFDAAREEDGNLHDKTIKQGA